MVDIILTKLGPSTVTSIGAASATALDFLGVFLNTDYRQDHGSPELSQNFSALPTFLVRQLELALCSTNSAFFRPSCLALALISAAKNNLSLEARELLIQNSCVFQSIEFLGLSDLFNLASACNVGFWFYLRRSSKCVHQMLDMLL